MTKNIYLDDIQLRKTVANNVYEGVKNMLKIIPVRKRSGKIYFYLKLSVITILVAIIAIQVWSRTYVAPEKQAVPQGVRLAKIQDVQVGERAVGRKPQWADEDRFSCVPEGVHHLDVLNEHVHHVESVGILFHNKCERYYKSDGNLRTFDGPNPQNGINSDYSKVCVGRNDQGEIYRFSMDHNQTKAHFNGIAGVGDGARNINRDYVPLRFNEMDNK